VVILDTVTTKTAISLPDDLFRDIERARKRARKDRSTWIQEAASDYLKKRTSAEEEEAYFSAYEKVPLSEDERAFDRWKAEHVAELFGENGRRRSTQKKR
jgi:metal-responsive CopG/Arc/MetJ family transcriptional regulator